MELSEEVYSVLFHYNPHKGVFTCFNRVDYKEYWNSQIPSRTGEGDTVEQAFANYKEKLLLTKIK